MNQFSKFTLPILICLFALNTSAQKEANIWYFGDSAGLDFNTNPPTPLLGSAMLATEGCASYADSNGNLLFYTDGNTIWNKNHQIMVNGTGILGGIDPTQGRLIIPKPGSSNIYYLFTVSDQSGYTFRYSEINISLQGGLGAVTSVKNVLLESSVEEALTAIRHMNSDSIWISVSRCCFAYQISSYLITSAGVNTTPVVYSGNSNWLYGIQSMKYSRNGERLGLATDHAACVLSMNTYTGALSKEYIYEPLGGYYGVEFSPSSRFMYVSARMNGNANIRQFDLDAGDSSSISNSEYLIDSVAFGTLQLAPNGQILIAPGHVDSLGSFKTPIAVVQLVVSSRTEFHSLEETHFMAYLSLSHHCLTLSSFIR